MNHTSNLRAPDTSRLGNRVEKFPVTTLNGPGRRWAIWTQGCSLLCTDNCLNPHFLDARNGWEYTTAEVIETLDQVHHKNPDLEGVTFLGGEPFDQAGPLSVIALAAQARGLSVMVYTGWRVESLVKRGPTASI